MTPRATIDALTGIRGVAASWVLLYHALPFDMPVIGHGYLGVDLFFLLSGFVLSHVYWHELDVYRASGHWTFLRRRAIRVYPLHLLTLAALVLLLFWWPELKTQGRQGQFEASEILPNALLLQNWAWNWFLPFSWNGVTWSLSAEILFYLAFPLYAPLIRRMPPVLAIFVVVGLIGSTITAVLASGWEFNAAGPAGILRAFTGFVGGVCLYALRRQCPGGRRRWNLLGVAAILFALAALLIPGMTMAILFGLAALVYAASYEESLLGRALGARPLVFLGDISYAVYLVQIPVLICWQQWLGRDTTAAIPVVLILASLVTLHIDQPLQRRLRQRFA